MTYTKADKLTWALEDHLCRSCGGRILRSVSGAGSALDYQMPQANRASVNPRLHARSVLPSADGETPARRAASAGASPSTSTSRAASAADTN